MPVNAKLLSGPNFGPRKHMTREKDEAFNAGAKMHGQGGDIEQCPKKFLPKLGDSELYDSFVSGFKVSREAQKKRAKRLLGLYQLNLSHWL